MTTKQKLPTVELKEIAAQIRDFQVAQGINDSDMLRHFAGLGSTKTYKLILEGATGGLNEDRWLLDYAAVLAQIEALAAGQTETEPLFDDLNGPTKLRSAFVDTMKETGNDRLIIIEGPSGAGKTKALLLLAAKFGAARVKIIQANETWKDSPRAMLAAIAAALDIAALPVSTAELLNKVTAVLREGRVCLAVDEAQHLGPRTLNIVKTLINETPGEIVLAALNTLWRKLELAAYEECRQLTRNRMAARINLAELSEKDVAKLLGRQREWTGDMKPILHATIEYAYPKGHLAAVKRMLRAARAKHDDTPLDLKQWTDLFDHQDSKKKGPVTR
jgi:hypothetical protein